jgi:CheY-like chemotaxis protein
MPRSVLIADDDRLFRESLCEALADLGWDADSAADGASAIAALNQRPRDLLLSDVDMPDMTGFQLLDWINNHPGPPTARVLMSARANPELDAAAKRVGAAALLAKPVHIIQLNHLVTSLFPAPPSARF